jgi:hypothetical protein
MIDYMINQNKIENKELTIDICQYNNSDGKVQFSPVQPTFGRTWNPT